jgi:hypothetical protein
MRHMIIGETKRFLRQHISEMDGFYFHLGSQPDSSTLYVRCKWSGRVDIIRSVTSEHELHGYRYEGQLILLENNNFTYGLYMYATHNRRPISRSIGAEDEETLFWHWASEITSRGPTNDDRDCFTACIKSVDAEER